MLLIDPIEAGFVAGARESILMEKLVAVFVQVMVCS